MKIKQEKIKNNKEYPELSQSYLEILKEIKEKVRVSQFQAAVKVNQELVQLYWEIGAAISNKQKEEGWGAKIIDRLGGDLRSAFPKMKGFSQRNLKYMLKFSLEYPRKEIVQQLVAQIPWGHNLILMERVQNQEERVWYIKKIIENGWSRNTLAHWIDSKLHMREGKAVTNFKVTLPAPQSDLAHQTLKDPYLFDFLTLREGYDERELEEGLVQHIQKFLLELGQGFAFVGRQYRLEVEESEYFLDLLFYHLDLRCYFVIELKATDFQPEYAGKLNFYLSAVDDLLKKSDDQPTIGILICKGRSKAKVEYALRRVHSPISIATYEAEIVKSLPENLKSSLPSVEEIEAEINRGTYEKS